jgi:hypothetical protein
VVLGGFATPYVDPLERREFLLVGSLQYCCYGVPPGPGGLVVVALDDDAPPIDWTLAPVVVRGRFAVDPVRVDDAGPPVALFRVRDARAAPLR